jgi:ribosome-binding protein aMBF1 (putative translation factor)
MASAKDKLNKLAEKEPSKWLEKARDRKAKRSWSDKSARIAIRVLREIRRQKPVNGMSQKVLAQKMEVSPQYINKVVKGEENLSLETISKLEDALGIELLQIK